MARTALAVTKLVPNDSIAQPAGTTGIADGHSFDCVPEELMLRVVVATATTTVTVKAGVHPPALSAGQGDLAESLAVGTHLVGPFTSARFVQQDGSVWVDYSTPANVTIAGIHMPRTA